MRATVQVTFGAYANLLLSDAIRWSPRRRAGELPATPEDPARAREREAVAACEYVTGITFTGQQSADLFAHQRPTRRA